MSGIKYLPLMSLVTNGLATLRWEGGSPAALLHLRIGNAPHKHAPHAVRRYGCGRSTSDTRRGRPFQAALFVLLFLLNSEFWILNS
jgi:hypothetical protein